MCDGVPHAHTHSHQLTGPTVSVTGMTAHLLVAIYLLALWFTIIMANWLP